MADNFSLLAVFPDLEPAADAIDKLRSLGISDDQMNVISGVPVTEAMLGRPNQQTNVPRLALGGAIGGFLIGVFLIFTPLIYFVPVHQHSRESQATRYPSRAFPLPTYAGCAGRGVLS